LSTISFLNIEHYAKVYLPEYILTVDDTLRPDNPGNQKPDDEELLRTSFDYSEDFMREIDMAVKTAIRTNNKSLTIRTRTGIESNLTSWRYRTGKIK
jgi:hypothetical protein